MSTTSSPEPGPTTITASTDTGVDVVSIETYTSPSSMRDWSRRQHAAGRTIAFVPTMGALHDGHMALVDHARTLADRVVVSIFVNPLQFDRPDDFAAYPIDLATDLERCRAGGVDVVYLPTAAEMYPEGFDTRVAPGRLGEGYEGAGRPGHFEGMLTVVTKLLTTVEPDTAVFGQKDAQQLALVRRLVADLDLSPRVVAHPTVRDPDGLAMSSRNRRLDAHQRHAALTIPRALRAMGDGRRAGRSVAECRRIGDEVLAGEPRLRVEYLDIVDRDRFVAAEDDTSSTGLLAIVAAWVDDIRLIDNLPIDD